MISYDEEYLTFAQRNLGDMLDYAVNSLDYELQAFFSMFIISGISKQIEMGNPTFILGRNGCELAKIIIEKTELRQIDEEDLMYTDKSPEYWTGWVLAYYQWQTGYSFEEISKYISVDEICEMYFPYHEADVIKVVEAIEFKKNKSSESMLARLRKYAGLTQKLLAEKSGVSLRQIQLFEQGQRDIHKTQADTVLALSKVLMCEPKDLLY